MTLTHQERSDLALLLQWWSAEEHARRMHLHPRLTSRNGALLLKVLLLALSNEESALNKRHFKNQIIEAFNVAPEMVDDRIRDLEDIGYLVTTKSNDGRDKILVASETACTNLAHYAAELIGSIAASIDYPSRATSTHHDVWHAGTSRADVKLMQGARSERP